MPKRTIPDTRAEKGNVRYRCQRKREPARGTSPHREADSAQCHPAEPSGPALHSSTLSGTTSTSIRGDVAKMIMMMVVMVMVMDDDG